MRARGQYRKATLIERYGADANMVDLRVDLAAVREDGLGDAHVLRDAQADGRGIGMAAGDRRIAETRAALPRSIVRPSMIMTLAP